jgi:hypothetical protein
MRVADGGTTHVELPVCSRGTWEAGFHSKIRAFVGERGVSVKASVPRFVPGPVACAAKPKQVASPPASPLATA